MQQDSGNSYEDAWSASFADSVRHAYFVEHGIREDKDIAEMIGISKGALSQRLSRSPILMKGDSLASLLRGLRSPELKTEVVVAWSQELMASEEQVPQTEAWGVTARRYQLRNRPDLALRLAQSAFENPSSPEDRWLAFLLSISCCFRLDVPGEVMRLCGSVREWGEREGIPELVAVAHAAGSRAMRRTLIFSIKQVDDERIRAEVLLKRIKAKGGSTESRLAAGAFSFAEEIAKSEFAEAAIRVHEMRGGQEVDLQEVLRRVHEDREQKAKTGPGRARAAQLAARVYLALKLPDKAEPYVREAMEEGAKEPSVRLEAEHLLGRMLVERGQTEEALAQLRLTAKYCARYRFVYLGRVIETEITRIELALMVSEQ